MKRPGRLLRSFLSTSGIMLLALAGPTPAKAGRSLEPLVSPGIDPCDDYSVGALSQDGQHLLITQRCDSPDPEDPSLRGTLWRQFRSSNDPANRVWTPGYFPGLSGDGRTAVGESLREIAPFGTRTEGIGLLDSGETFGIGVLPGDNPWAGTFATAISEDGMSVVGGGTNASGDQVPVRWTAATGLQEIPLGPTSPPCTEDCSLHQGHATGVNHDGSVIVGNVDGRAFRWDAIQGRRPLLDDGGDAIFSLQALAISGDGTSIVGTGIFEAESRPFISSEATGLRDLHDPTTGLGQGLVPKSISRDGLVVVGGEQFGFPISTFSFEDHAFIWRRDKGIQDLRTALEDLGLETAAWASLASAWAVSGDGSTIVGTGYRNLDGGYAKTFHASLLPAPRLGVGLCDLAEPDCVGVEILARSGQTFRYGSELSTLAMGRVLSFYPAILNASGHVAFGARVEDWQASQIGANGAEWSVVFGPDGDGKSRICPINPFTVPSLGIGQSWFPDVDPRTLALLDDGDVYFGGTSAATGNGIWRCNARSNEVGSLAFVGGRVPEGSGEEILEIFDKFQVDAHGRVSFRARTSTSGGSARSIVGPGSSGNLEVRIRSEELPPGVTDLPYGGSYFHTMGASGKLSFVGVLGPFGEHGLEEQDALWGTEQDGELTLILRTGDPAPGFSGAMTFGSMNEDHTPAVNSRGDVVTTATLEGSGSLDSSVWKWSPGGPLTLIARAGDALPHLVPGHSVVGFDKPLINDRGDILLSVVLSYGPSHHNHGYWLHTAEGERVSLLQTGQAAPSLPDGVVLGESTWVEVLNDPDEIDHAYHALAESGLSLLEFYLEGVGVDATNDRALFLLDRTGAPTLVLRRGDEIPVAHEDVRTVSDFRIGYGYRDGYGRSPINDRGEVVAILEFTDGTQAVAKLAVPEPELFSALAIGSIVLCLMRIAGPAPRRSNRA